MGRREWEKTGISSGQWGRMEDGKGGRVVEFYCTGYPFA